MTGSLDRDRGSVTVLLLGLVPALLGCAGLVWDGGHALAARAQAADTAEAAARAGADVLDVDAARGGHDRIAIHPAQARACALALRELPHAACTANATNSTVTVTIRVSTGTVFLGLVGLTTLRVDGKATATVITGPNTRRGAGP
jgi:Flp pilus assembly protein TadG